MKELLHGGKGTATTAERTQERAPTAPEAQESRTVEPMGDEFSSEELREFLEADRLDVRADPVFKERLREKLWEMVRRARNEGTDEG